LSKEQNALTGASISRSSPFHIFLDKKCNASVTEDFEPKSGRVEQQSVRVVLLVFRQFTFFSTKAEDRLKIGATHIESRNVGSANLHLLQICQMSLS
jgi:hypothetical protein